MKKIITGVLSVAAVALANTGEIKQKFHKAFPNTQIEKIEESPVKCLYEVQTKNGKIIYTDGEHLVIGHIFTFKGKDLTQEKIDQITAKNVEQIDLSKALKIGSGKTKVIEISDPKCPFCRRAESFFKDKDVSRYIFFYPLPFHKNAKPLSIHILCSDNPEEEYKKVMEGKLDNSDKLIYCKQGEEKLKQMEEVAKSLKVRGTPMFWVKTGQGWKKIEGANPKILNLLSKKEVKQ
ncbi:DsbC family protein [Persephonella sp.]